MSKVKDKEEEYEDLDSYLLDLQDALLTEDQVLITKMKKRYEEQVFLRRKKKTDEADRKKEEKENNLQKHLLKQSQINRRTIMLEKEKLLEEKEKELDKLHETIMKRAQDEAKDKEKRDKERKRIERERCNLANTHNQKIEDTIKEQKEFIKQKQNQQQEQLKQERKEDEEKQKEQSKKQWQKQVEKYNAVRKEAEEEKQQQKELKKANKKIFEMEVKEMKEEDKKQEQREKEAIQRQVGLVNKRKQDQYETSSLIGSQYDAVEERKSVLMQELNKKYENIDNKKAEEIARLQEKGRKRDEKIQLYIWKAESQEEYRQVKLQNKMNLQEYILNEMKSEQQDYLEWKKNYSLMKQQQAEELKFQNHMRNVDKINGYVDQLEKDDEMTYNLFQQQSLQHKMKFENKQKEVDQRRKQAKKIQEEKERKIEQKMIADQQKAQFVMEQNRIIQSSGYEEKRELIKYNLKQKEKIDEARRQQILRQIEMDDLKYSQSLQNKSASLYFFKRNRLIKTASQQENIKDIQIAKKHRLSQIALKTLQKGDRIDKREQEKEKIIEMRRILTIKAQKAKEQEFKKLKSIMLSNKQRRPNSANPYSRQNILQDYY